MKRMTILVIVALLSATAGAQPREYREKLILMGELFEFTVVTGEEQEEGVEELLEKATAEVRRIERMISASKEGSPVAMINGEAGIQPVKVDEELYGLIERAVAISRMTGGAFDITYASISDLWKFDGSMKEMPSAEQVAESVAKTGYGKITLDPLGPSVFLREKGMKIGLEGIGKGYAVDRVREILINEGLMGWVVNAGGDLYAWGADAEGRPWKVGVSAPGIPDMIAAWFEVTNMAVVTSGHYDDFIELRGWRFSPVIDPRTGWPVEDVRSVTVICSNAALADGLATAIFVMGRDEGLELVNGLNGIECLVISSDGHLWASKNLKLNATTDEGVYYRVGR